MNSNEFSTPQVLKAKKLASLDWYLAWAATLGPIVGMLVVMAFMFFGYWPGFLELVLLASMYILTFTGIEVGYHRHFSHHAFRAKRPVRILLAILGSMALQGPVIWWVATHRRHHKYSDGVGDPHSPHCTVKGKKTRLFFALLHAQMGWLFCPESTRAIGWNKYATDLYLDKYILKIHMTYVYWVLAGLVIPALLGLMVTGGLYGALNAFLWGGPVRIFLVSNFVWGVNSICHKWGEQSFETGDCSKNNLWLALLTMGGAWHNDHHAYPNVAVLRNNWVLDPAGFLIKTFDKVGFAWDIKRLPPAG